MNTDFYLAAMKSQGKQDALDLRNRAKNMDDTAIIDEENKVPDYNPKKDYTSCPQGTPVKFGGQVYKLLQPHNASHYGGNPETLPALWSLCHTKNPLKAKPWMPPKGTSGMYMKGECYIDINNVVHECLEDNVVHDAVARSSAWKTVS